MKPWNEVMKVYQHFFEDKHEDFEGLEVEDLEMFLIIADPSSDKANMFSSLLSTQSMQGGGSFYALF